MSVLDFLTGIIAPHLCVGCQCEATLLCPLCEADLPLSTSQCYRCGLPSSDNKTCSRCLEMGGILEVRAATSYAGVAKDLVWRLKSGGAQAAARNMAHLTAPLINNKLRAVLVPVPTSTARRRQRGYDQATLLARELSKATGLPALSCLARLGNQHQVGAKRQQRIAQLQRAYRAVRLPPPGYTIILVDDVLTTGATLESAASALQQVDVSAITAVVFARA